MNNTAIPAPDSGRRHIERRSARPAGPRVQVIYRGVVIADSRDALRLDEMNFPAAYYFPRRDVKMDRLERSHHESFSPYKGYATYYSIKDGPENAVWSYEDPYDRMRALEGRLAFYADKVDSIVVG